MTYLSLNLIFQKLDNYEWIDKLFLQFNDIELLLVYADQFFFWGAWMKKYNVY